MPLPQSKRSAFTDFPPSAQEADHYFGRVHGDVAALQARIERGFADLPFDRAPASELGLWAEQAVESLSRAAGVLGLIGALGAIAYALI